MTSRSGITFARMMEREEADKLAGLCGRWNGTIMLRKEGWDMLRVRWESNPSFFRWRCDEPSKKRREEMVPTRLELTTRMFKAETSALPSVEGECRGEKKQPRQLRIRTGDLRAKKVTTLL